jgi:hypothetical protein
MQSEGATGRQRGVGYGGYDAQGTAATVRTYALTCATSAAVQNV